MARMSAEEAGTRAFDALAPRLGGLNRKMWRHYASLTESELRRGIDWLRDLFEDERDVFVKIWRGEWIYVIAVNDRDWREHLLRHLRTQITRCTREYNAIVKAARLHPSRENEWNVIQARRALEDYQHRLETIFGEDAA